MSEWQRELLDEPEEITEQLTHSTYEAQGHYFLREVGIPMTVDTVEIAKDYMAFANPVSKFLSYVATGSEESEILRDINTSSKLFPLTSPEKVTRLQQIRADALERNGIIVGIRAEKFLAT